MQRAVRSGGVAPPPGARCYRPNATSHNMPATAGSPGQSR